MKFSICVPCFFKNLPAPEAVRKIGGAGFRAAEFWRVNKAELIETRAAANEAGVEIVSLCADDFRMNQPEYRREWLSGLESAIDSARILGAKKLITQVGQDTGEPRARQRAAILNALEAAKPILDAGGVTLMLEPLNTAYDHKGYYLDTAGEGAEIAAACAHPRVRLILDFYHQQAQGGDLINTYLSMKDFVAHVHIAGNPGRNEPWLGETNYARVFQALRDAGYAGAVGVEYMPRLEPVKSLLAFKQAYANEF